MRLDLELEKALMLSHCRLQPSQLSSILFSQESLRGREMPINLIGLSEAAAMINDGDQVAVSGGMDMTPMALMRELVRRSAQKLRFVAAPGAGLSCDLLAGAGVLQSAEFAQVSLGEYGMAPNFRRCVQAGKLRTLDHT